MVNVFPVPALASSTVVPSGSGPSRSNGSGAAGTAALTSAPVGVGPWSDRQHRDRLLVLVDPVDDAVGAAASAVPIGERRLQTLANALWVVEQRSDDELVRGERHRLGQDVGQLPTRGRRDDQ